MDNSKAPSKPIRLNYSSGKLILTFDTNHHTRIKIKSMQGVKFNKSTERWEAPLSCYNHIVTNLDNLVISTEVIKVFAEDAELQRRVKKLRSDDYYELEDYSPKVPLMSHQKKAFELHRILKGSGNWSEMGAGKTGSAICAIHWHLEMGNIDKALVVAPKSVLRGWEEQIEFFSDLSYISIVGTKSQRDKKLALDRNIYLINYGYTWRIIDDLLDRSFSMVICDEVHRIKNPLAKQSKACYSLGDAATYRIALTGTPILNTPLDAFGVMRFVDPGVFGESFYSFRNKLFKNVGSENSPIKVYVPRQGAEEFISNALYTKALRFLKAQCLDLPEATHLPNRIVTLSAEQDKAYRNLQEELSAQITEDESITITHVLTLMLKLSQVTSGWIKNTETQEIIRFKTNPKLEELKTLVEEAGDQPIIIWAYYTEDMHQIINHFSRCSKCKELVNKVPGDTCRKCGTYIRYRCSEVQGSTKHRNAEIATFRLTQEERAELRSRFIEEGRSKSEIRNELGDLIEDKSSCSFVEPPQTNIIVCQCVAASEGLNLQRATLAIFYSRNWSLKDWVQALARNHRKGQGKKVTYVSLVARMRNGDNTVDQRIADALDKKVNLSKRVNKDELAQILVKDLKAKSKAVDKLIEDASYSE